MLCDAEELIFLYYIGKALFSLAKDTVKKTNCIALNLAVRFIPQTAIAFFQSCTMDYPVD